MCLERQKQMQRTWIFDTWHAGEDNEKLIWKQASGEKGPGLRPEKLLHLSYYKANFVVLTQKPVIYAIFLHKKQ